MGIRLSLAALLAVTLATGAFGQPQPAASSPVAAPSMPPAPASLPPAVEVTGPPTCNGPCCDCFAPVCGPPGRVWGSVDALGWWIKAANLPALVTTSPPGTPRSQAGVLGPGTTVVFGDTWVDGGFRGGAQVDLGFWFDPEQNFGFQTSFFGVQNLGGGFAASSNGNPILARPFTDVTTGSAASALIAFPGVATGNVVVGQTSTSLIGTGAWLRENVLRRSTYRLDALAGYRYLHFGDGVLVMENITNLEAGGLVPPGTNLVPNDTFNANNNFNGFDFGFVGQTWRGRWLLETQAKLAVGWTAEALKVQGGTTITVPGSSPIVRSGGLLALDTNIGSFHKQAWTLVPEFGCRAGYRISSSIYCYLGYTFLYWSSVVRSGSQIDLGVNPKLIPPSTGAVDRRSSRPEPLLHASDLWAQGLNLGLEFRF